VTKRWVKIHDKNRSIFMKIYKTYFYNTSKAEKIFTLAIFLILWFVLVMISGLKPVGFDRDSKTYVAFLSYNPSEYNLLVFEPLHWGLVYLNNILFNANPHTFFALYAVIFLTISLYAIYKDSSFPLISLFIFVLLFFPLYGLTQIRQGVAVALLLYSIKDLSKDRIKHFFIKAIIATGFHYSAPILFSVLFISRKMKLPVLVVIILPIFCIVLGKVLPILSMLYYLADLIGGPFGYKLNHYLFIMEQFGEKHPFNVTNPFNRYTLFIFGCGVIFGFLYKKRMDTHKSILFNLLFLSLSVLFLFLQLPILSNRLFFPLSSVSIFIFPYIIYKTKPRIVAVTLLVLLILALSFNMYIRDDLFNFDLIL